MQINKTTNECDMCGEEHDPLESQIFILRGWTICVCNDCSCKLMSYIRDFKKISEIGDR